MSEAGENIRLQKAVEQYRKKGTDEAYYAILDAVEECVRLDAEVWINGNPIPGDPDHVDPAGMEGDDGQFYMMIFSSREASNHGENQHPMLVGVRDMIATDVAARGINLSDLDLVISLGWPDQEEFLVHRISRTARSGKPGKAILLLSPKEKDRISRIPALTGRTSRTLPIRSEKQTAKHPRH